MRRLAVFIALIGFFLFAGVGIAHGLSPFACSVRALTAAGVLYVVARIASIAGCHVLAEVFAGMMPDDQEETRDTGSK